MDQRSKLFMLLCVLGVLVLVCDLCARNAFASGDDDDDDEGKAKGPKNRAELVEAYKRLYRREIPLDPDEALKLLQVLATVYGQVSPSGVAYETPIDTLKLIEYANVNETKCSQPNKVIDMREDYNLAKNQYPALLPFVAKHFKAQFELCGFHVKYREDFKNFKEGNPRGWAKISAFKDRVSKFGKIGKNWKGNKLDNPIQFNEAFTDLYQDTKKETGSGGRWWKHRGDAAIKAYNEAHVILDNSRGFLKQVGPSITLATFHPDSVQEDEELRDAMRHHNAYRQAVSTNYERSMSPMFADAFYDKDDRGWTAYENFKNLFL